MSKRKRQKRPPIKSVKSGHGQDGRFLPGNPGGPGRPPGFRQELQGAFNESFTPADLRKIAFRLKQAAASGNIRAVELILNRLIGPVNFVARLVDADTYNPDDTFL